MKILCIGDVVGDNGCDFLEKRLPELKKRYDIDFCIVNGENASEGNGILPVAANRIFTFGADVITGGNHTARRKEIYTALEENDFLLRPANLPSAIPGKGICICDLGYTSIAVINILGTVYMESMNSPFETADKLIEEAKGEGAKIIIVDFHAEATSEKRAMGFYLDGKVTALFGTHTHVQTNDAQLLPKGTAYITDIGMTGPKHSVLGVDKDIIISKMKDKMPVRFLNSDEKPMLSGIVIDVDREGKAIGIAAINEE